MVKESKAPQEKRKIKGITKPPKPPEKKKK